MRVYFTASISKKETYIDNYRLIVDHLTKTMHTTIFEHIFEETEQSISTMSREQRLAFQSKVEGWIRSCDFVIAETSFPSVSVGYEIAFAFRLGKPVLVLYSEGDAPSLLTYHSYTQ